MKGFIKENINSETCLILGALQKVNKKEGEMSYASQNKTKVNSKYATFDLNFHRR